MECSYLNGFLGTSCPDATIYIRNKWFCWNHWKLVENFTDKQEKEEKKLDPPKSQEINRWELI
jgi:hypothetical protein